MSRLSSYAEPFLHLALLAGAAALAWTLWSSGAPTDAADGPTVQIDSSAVLSSWRPSDHRIFLFLSPTCRYCERSMGFYARLTETADSVRKSGPPVSVAAAINRSSSPRAQRRMLRSAGVAVDTLLVLPEGPEVGVSGVPTVAVDRAGTERPSAWEGLQDSTSEQEILSAVQELGGAR